MKHQHLIENFVQKGAGGRGANIVAKEKDGVMYTTYQPQWPIPLAIRLENAGFLANGVRLDRPGNRHHQLVLRTLERAGVPFGVVPFDSITAAWTHGEIHNWYRAPSILKDLRKEVEIVVSSVGERWRNVEIKDKYGNVVRTQTVHTLGDSVIRVQDRFYVSGVDETSRLPGGIYFLGASGYLVALGSRSRPPQWK
jgi:hypothetical protein